MVPAIGPRTGRKLATPKAATASTAPAAPAIAYLRRSLIAATRSAPWAIHYVKTAFGASPLLDRLKRVGEVGDEVLGVLDPDRNPDEVGGDVELLLALVGNRQMRHRRWGAGQR